MNNLTETGFPWVFDGHNDVLSRLSRMGGAEVAETFMMATDGAINLPAARTGGFGGGFFAMYVSSPENKATFKAMNQPVYDVPLPEPVAFTHAMPQILRQASILIRLEELNALTICYNTQDIRQALASGEMAAIMHMEGAEAIDKDLHALDLFYRAGLRSIGPVWSRPTIFGHGVPFRFPSDGNIGDGLSEQGIRLIKRCNELGIVIDLSHLNEAGFWDVAKYSDAPLVATHSNAHKLCNSSRNLSDRQLEAIANSDGMVGVNFAVSFLRDDGKNSSDVTLDMVIRHFDYLIEKLGEERVGFGSDYDGALVPEAISSVLDLPKLLEAMRTHGFDDALLTKLCHANWLHVLEKTWHK